MTKRIDKPDRKGKANYAEATRWICDEIEDHIVDGAINLPETNGCFLRMLALEGFRQRNWRDHLYYEITEEAAQEISRVADSDPNCFDACADICMSNIELGVRLPRPLIDFVSSVLFGDRKRPVRKGRPRHADFVKARDLYYFVRRASREFGLSVSRNDATAVHESACDAVAEAFTVCGCPTTYDEVKRIAVHRDFKRFRDEQREVSSAMDDYFERTQKPVN